MTLRANLITEQLPAPRHGKWLRSESQRATGIVWFSQLPAHWTVRPAKALLSRNDGGCWGDEPDGEADTIVLRSTEQTVGGGWQIQAPAMRKLSKRERANCCLRAGDLVITKSSGSELHIGKTSIVDDAIEAMESCYSNFMQRLRCRKELIPRFLFYVLNSPIGRDQFVYGSNSTTGLANLTGTMIGNLRLPVPLTDEQRAIAAFLDRETAKFDVLIGKKLRLTELLNKKRIAAISRAVIQGTRDDVEMRDSGVPWIGRVPSHWSVLPFKRVTTRVDVGIAEAATHAYASEGVPIVRSTNIKTGKVICDDLLFIEQEFADKLSSKTLRAGDIVTTRTGANLGVSAVIPAALHMSQCFTLLISSLRPDADSRFYTYFINALPGRVHFARSAWGSGQCNISVPILQELPTVKPPLDEQRAIVLAIEHEDAKLEALQSAVNTQLGKLVACRAALISAAVTGQIDVRNHRAEVSA